MVVLMVDLNRPQRFNQFAVQTPCVLECSVAKVGGDSMQTVAPILEQGHMT